jgi:hypothetical protein
MQLANTNISENMLKGLTLGSSKTSIISIENEKDAKTANSSH